MVDGRRRHLKSQNRNSLKTMWFLEKKEVFGRKRGGFECGRRGRNGFGGGGE